MVKRVGRPDLCDRCGDRIGSTDWRHVGAFGHQVLCIPCFVQLEGGVIIGP